MQSFFNEKGDFFGTMSMTKSCIGALAPELMPPTLVFTIFFLL